MLGHDSRALANEFTRRERLPMPQAKIHNLVFISVGWNLAINREPLTTDRVEARDGGPVFPIIWKHIRDFGYAKNGPLLCDRHTVPYVADLTAGEREVIERVWIRYGQLTALELARLSLTEGTPWSNAFFGRHRNAPISHAEMERCFVALALAGRSQMVSA
jgi:uncharacterized phage-associated protein